MKINYNPLLCVAMCSLILSCADVENSLTLDNQQTLEPETVEYPVPASADFNIDVQLGSHHIDSVLLQMDPRPVVRFTIWAFDQIAADVAATEIKVEEYDLRPRSALYPLRFNEQDLQAIEFQSGSTDAIRYYITLDVDVDRDGVACNGDFRQDFNLSAPEFYPVTQTDYERMIELVEIDGEICP